MPLDRRSCLIRLAGLGLSVHGAAHAAVNTQRPLLMEARDAPDAFDPRGWLASEKLDGVRAFWNGKTLRFRSGGLIAAPTWFTAVLPSMPLDGELWAGRGRFEALVGTVRRQTPDDAAWRRVCYALFDLPGSGDPFAQRARQLQQWAVSSGASHVIAIAQDPVRDTADLLRRRDAVVAQGGEGLMLHRADAFWRPGRSADLLKFKLLADAEAVVIGHEPGQGRHAGRLGALTVKRPDGRQFRLGTGFSDAERDAPPPTGAVVTYTYRGLTDNGLPRFASFLRVRRLP